MLSNTVSVDFVRIEALASANEERVTVFAEVSDCERGRGTLNAKIGGHDFKFENVIAPPRAQRDILFGQLCAAGLPVVNERLARIRARWDAMTPAEREAAWRSDMQELRDTIRLMDLLIRGR